MLPFSRTSYQNIAKTSGATDTVRSAQLISLCTKVQGAIILVEAFIESIKIICLQCKQTHKINEMHA